MDYTDLTLDEKITEVDENWVKLDDEGKREVVMLLAFKVVLEPFTTDMDVVKYVFARALNEGIDAPDFREI